MSDMKRILMATVFMAVSLPAMANGQQVGGDVNMPAGLTNGNFQNGVNAAISTGQIGSNSAARSRSNATGGAGGTGGTGGAGGQGGRSNASGGASSVTNNIGNGSGGLMGSQPNDVTVRSAPNAYAPAIFGANPCSVGISGAGSWIAAGIGIGGQWESADCARRDMYRMHVAAGNMTAAKGTACLIAEQRKMFMEIGDPCPQDRPRQVAAPQPIPQPVGMNAATARDPRPSRAQCNSIRRLADPTQVQRDYLAANCG